jgi:hypothetical protein
MNLHMSDFLVSTHLSPKLKRYNQYSEEISNAFAGNINNHDDANDDFATQEFDQELFPYQRADCIRVSGTNAGPELLRGLASEIYPNVDPIIDSFKKRPDLLNHIYDKFTSNEKVGLVADHYASVIGVAIAGGSLACAMYEEGYLSPNDLKTGIFVSSMIKRTLLKKELPTVEVMSAVFSEVLFSLPPSESVRDLILPENYRANFNSEIKDDFNGMEDTPMLLMLAGSGTRDRLGTLSFNRKRIFMGPLANGTIDILRGIYHIGVGIDIKEEKPYTYIDKLHRPIDSSEEAHLTMHNIATGMSRGLRTRRKYYRTRESYREAWQKTLEYKASLDKVD